MAAGENQTQKIVLQRLLEQVRFLGIGRRQLPMDSALSKISSVTAEVSFIGIVSGGLQSVVMPALAAAIVSLAILAL